mmetsp:Transcript_68494/g.210036  ORF Transcript_68494/g.210036 Transcript_68494/m.210036 type:complete len:240 (-) Transcript_68494:10-729(-)
MRQNEWLRAVPETGLPGHVADRAPAPVSRDGDLVLHRRRSARDVGRLDRARLLLPLPLELVVSDQINDLIIVRRHPAPAGGAGPRSTAEGARSLALQAHPRERHQAGAVCFERRRRQAATPQQTPAGRAVRGSRRRQAGDPGSQIATLRLQLARRNCARAQLAALGLQVSNAGLQITALLPQFARRSHVRAQIAALGLEVGKGFLQGLMLACKIDQALPEGPGGHGVRRRRVGSQTYMA